MIVRDISHDGCCYVTCTLIEELQNCPKIRDLPDLEEVGRRM